MDLKWGEECGIDSPGSGSGQGPVAGCYEQGNEPLVSKIGGEFLDQLCEYQVLKDSNKWRAVTKVKS
jgi:hypothetical protein